MASNTRAIAERALPAPRRLGRESTRVLLIGVLLPTVALASAEDGTPQAPDAINTIIVEGRKLNVETRIDRKIYTLPDDAQSTVGTLSDILSVIPSVDVDPDGVLSLRGDTNVLVLIDGKPATQLQGSKAGDNLQSLPANDIERIEILTTPPAQFKADGAAGIINIITRKHVPHEPASGSLQGSMGDGGRSLFGARGSYGNGRFMGSLGASYREDYRQRILESDIATPDSTTGGGLESRDYVSEHARRNIPSVDLSTEYDLDEHRSLSGSVSWTRRGGLRIYTQLDDSTVPSGMLTSSTRRLSIGHDPENDYDTALRFSQKLGAPGESLDISVHRSVSHQHEHYDYTNDSFIPPLPPFYDNLSFVEDHGVTDAGADYSLPLSKTQSLKLGYAFEQDDYGLANTGENVDALTGAATIDPAVTNDFKVRQRIQAIYQSYQATRGPWTLLAGLRTEWTTTDAMQLAHDASISTSYAEVYPSLHVERSISDHGTWSFGASRRVQRPDPSYLNPYIDYEYTPNLQGGNPNLRPQLTQSYELGYAYDARESYGVTAYYRRNRDSVTTVTDYLGSGVSLTTKANLPKSDSAGLEFSATGPLLPKLSYSVSGNAFYSQIDAQALGTPGLRSTSGINAKAKLDFRPTAEDSAQISFVRTDKRLTPQGSVGAINVVNLGYKRGITRALSLVATVSDLFSGQRYTRIAVTPTFTQIYQRHVEGRIAFVGFTYALGAAKKEKPANFDYDSGN